MKNVLFTSIRICLITVLFIPIKISAQKQNISLEDIWLKNTFATKGVSGFTSLKDGKYYCELDSVQNLIRYEFSTGNEMDTLVKHFELKNNQGKEIDFSNFEFSDDENKILITTEHEQIYRHSSRSLFFVFDLKKRKLFQPINEKVRYPNFSPDGTKVAYIKENDLFYYDLFLQKEERITKDGKTNSIINGSTDWVYEEEFAIYKAFFWSLGSDKIAFYRFDESKVKEFEMTMYGKLYPEQSKFKYPKAGEDNSVLNLFVYDLRSQLLAGMDIGKESDIYIPRIKWTNDNNTLCITRLNRIQNKLELLLADANTGISKIIYTEENKYYIDINDVAFLQKNKGFLIQSERDGRNQIYQYTMNGKLINQITKGNFDVADFYGIDEKNKTIFFSSFETNPYERYVYSMGMKGTNKKKLSVKRGWNSATFNSDFTYFLNVNSNINTPSYYSLYDKLGKEIRVLETNQKAIEKLQKFTISNAEFNTIKTSEGLSLFSWIIKPINFDSTKKYPVLMYVYGGPGSQTVIDRWGGSNYLWYQMLAQKGYIIISVDNRGTGFRGEEFKKCTYLQLGKYETEDQIAAAKEIAKLPYVDASRIGIWGWSYGGYMSSLCISKGADVFKTAIAVAPVTNWRFYDNIYTERYMRTPQENGKNYDLNSPINHIEKIKGNYLIIHGTADDNVHFQNTVEMIDAMSNKGIKYDSEFYPNKNHGIGGRKTRLHLYEKMTNFLLEKL